MCKNVSYIYYILYYYYINESVSQWIGEPQGNECVGKAKGKTIFQSRLKRVLYEKACFMPLLWLVFAILRLTKRAQTGANKYLPLEVNAGYYAVSEGRKNSDFQWIRPNGIGARMKWKIFALAHCTAGSFSVALGCFAFRVTAWPRGTSLRQWRHAMQQMYEAIMFPWPNSATMVNPNRNPRRRKYLSS